MLIHPADPGHPLVEPSDLESPGAPALPTPLAGYEAPLRRTLQWAREYLCNPHPELGRKGDVCPFVGTAIKRSTFYMTVWRGVPSDRDEVEVVVRRFREWFGELEPRHGAAAQFKTMLVIFPDLADDDVPHVIDATQDQLKGEYVQAGLMLGEFHAGPPDKAGLWNADFRPLVSPVPLLAIRHMVPTDFPFLRDDPDHVSSYLARFGDRVPSFLQEEVAATVARHALTGPAGHGALAGPAFADAAVAVPATAGLTVDLAVEIPARPAPNAAVDLAAGLAATPTAEVAGDLSACPVTGTIDPGARPAAPAEAESCPVDHTGSPVRPAEAPGALR